MSRSFGGGRPGWQAGRPPTRLAPAPTPVRALSHVGSRDVTRNSAPSAAVNAEQVRSRQTINLSIGGHGQRGVAVKASAKQRMRCGLGLDPTARLLFHVYEYRNYLCVCGGGGLWYFSTFFSIPISFEIMGFQGSRVLPIFTLKFNS